MRRFWISAAIAALCITPAWGETLAIAVPHAMPDAAAELKAELWELFITDVGPGDTYLLLDGSTPGLIARFDVPQDDKFARPKWRLKHFASENQQLGVFLEGITDGAPQTDVTGILRHVALNRIDPEISWHLMIIGRAVQPTHYAPSFAMRTKDGLRVPSAGHLAADVGQTPWGMGIEGKDGLRNVSVHICPVADDLSSDAEAAFQAFWGQYVAARGGALVTWTDDLATCFDRFAARVTTPLDVPPLGDGDGMLTMDPITAQDHPIEPEPQRTIVNGVEVESFNLFSSQAHPRLPWVDVMTGILYQPDRYPDQFEKAWCYFHITREGVEYRFDLGGKDWSSAVQEERASAKALRAGGISRAEFNAGRSACQWPTP